MITIEKMKKEYIDEVYEIDKASVPIPWSKNSIEEEMNNILAKFIVAKDGDIVIGFAMCWFIMDECHIGNLAVLPSYRNQGVATKLLDDLLKECDEHGTNYLLLEVRVSNTPAINLYKKLGFEESVVRKHYYKNPDGTYEDALIMSKDRV
ncbi:MAG: ribosomal protein S18-alanine N-acetyltransferase [Clostridia bacterium]|nr:ribosomal protein S18-alanine N-acetyltransferase [Clostridia bacterium]